MFYIKEIDMGLEKTQVDIESLMYDHFREVTTGDESKLLPNWEVYKSLQEKKQLVALGGFYNDVMIGYVILLVISPLHYKTTTIAVSDTIFVDKSFRNSTLGLRFIKESEQKAKILGATKVNWYVKENSNLETLFEKKKYKVRDIIMTKDL